MSIGTANFPELLWPGIHDIWGAEYAQYEKLYRKIFEIKKSDKRFEKEQGVTGFGLASIKDEGSPATFDRPYQGLQKEYVHTVYTLGTTVTREMVDDEQYGYINKLPKYLARSLYQTEETIGFNHLNRHSTSGYTGADGVTLASASHPLVAGGTYRNQLANAADLTQTSLETAVQDLMDFVDDQSLKIRVMPVTLVVPTALNFTAKKILETDRAVGSNDNDKNVVKGSMKLIVSPWLTDPDTWFVITDCPDGLTWYDRWPAEMHRENEFDTMNLKMFTSRRFSSGWTNPRGVFVGIGA